MFYLNKDENTKLDHYLIYKGYGISNRKGWLEKSRYKMEKKIQVGIEKSRFAGIKRVISKTTLGLRSKKLPLAELLN